MLGAKTVADDLVEADVVFAFLQDVAVFIVDEMRVAVEHAVRLDAGAGKAESGAADDGVRGRRRSAGEENSDFFDV